MRKLLVAGFLLLGGLALLAPLVVDVGLLFPLITTKVFWFRTAIELALPFYVALLLIDPTLRPNMRNPITLLVLGFLALNVTSALLGIDLQRSLWGSFDRMGGVFVLAHLVLLYFYSLLLLRLGNGWPRAGLYLFLAVPAIAAASGISGKLGGPTLVTDGFLPARASSTLGNPLYFAAYMVVPIFLGLYLGALYKQRVWRVLALLAAAICAAGVYVSGTRAAELGVAAGLLLAAVIYLARLRNPRVQKAGAAVLAMVLVLMAIAGATGGRLSGLLNGNDTKARLIEWSTALHGYPAHPWFGVGPENYYYISNRYFDPSIYAYDPGPFYNPHNYWLELLTTTGPLGLALYLAIVVFTFRAAWLAYRRRRIALAPFAVLAGAIVAYQLQNLAGFEMLASGITFFAFTAFVAGFQERPMAVKSTRRARPAGAWGALVVTGVMAVLVAATANLTQMQEASRLQAAKIAATSDTNLAYADYDQVLANTVFDPGEVAVRLGSFADAAALAANNAAQPSALQIMLDRAIGFSSKLVAQNPTNESACMSLAQSRLVAALLFGESPAAVEVAAQKAVALAPRRPEPQLLLTRAWILEKRLGDARSRLQQLAQTFPADPDVFSEEALLAYRSGDAGGGALLLQQALRLGYVPQNLSDVKWAGDYYASTKQYGLEVRLYELALRRSPSNLGLAVELFYAYQANGQIQAALQLESQIAAVNPTLAAQLHG